MNALRSHWISPTAQRTIPFTRLMIGMYPIGLDRLWLLPPFLPQRFMIKDPSEIEARCLPLAAVDVIQVQEGGRTTCDVRHVVRAVVDVETVLSQVSA